MLFTPARLDFPGSLAPGITRRYILPQILFYMWRPKKFYDFFVPETYILHLPDSCRFINCSVSISIFCHVVWQSWPNHMAEYWKWQNMEMAENCWSRNVGGTGYLVNMYVKSVPSIGYYFVLGPWITSLVFWALKLLHCPVFWALKSLFSGDSCTKKW